MRVVSLGSRRNLCINPSVKVLSEQRINDACLDLQQEKSEPSREGEGVSEEKGKRKRQKGCPFRGAELERDFVDRSLAKVMDIEETVSLAEDIGSCAYYGSREAAKLAELVVLPYASLLHRGTRESLGVHLKGNVVILDEAHNIIETINAVLDLSLTLSC